MFIYLTPSQGYSLYTHDNTHAQAQANKLGFLGSCFGRIFPEKHSGDNKFAKYWNKTTICLDKQNGG